MMFESQVYTTDQVRARTFEMIDIWADNPEPIAMVKAANLVETIDREAGRDGLMCVCIYLAHVHTHVSTGSCAEEDVDRLPPLVDPQPSELTICPNFADVQEFNRAARYGDFDTASEVFKKRVRVEWNVGNDMAASVFVVTLIRLALRNLGNTAEALQNDMRQASRFN